MPVRIDEEARRVEASVGDLVPGEEADPFAPSRGGFARLVAGVRAHVQYAEAAIAADPSYAKEVPVRGELQVDGWTVVVTGRVDGLRRAPHAGDAIVVEEVKSVVMSEAAFAALHAGSYPAYLLQLRIYLHLLGHEQGSLVFVNLAARTGTRARAFAIAADPAGVVGLVAERVRELVAEHASEQRRLAARRQLATEIAFPFPQRRPLQAEMEAAADQAFARGECLLVSAPPGLGKTAAALTAALRHALAHDRRVFFVTAKTTEQRIVTQTLARLVAAHPGLTAVHLRAKAKICLNDVVFCHPEVCEYARDYPAKVATAGSRELLLALGLADPDRVRAEGQRARACPFELELDLTERADVVVGDYNYVFDPAVAIRRRFDGEAPSEDLVLIIDEAHNLVDRAREYYSPALDSGHVRELLLLAEARAGEVWRALETWLASLLALFGRLLRDACDLEPLRDPAGGPATWAVGRELDAVRLLRTELETILVSYFAWRRECGSVDPDDPVLDVAFDFLRLARVLELEGDELVPLLEPRAEGSVVWRVLCLDASRQLGRRLKAFHAVLAMSATLEPAEYYRDLLGFPKARTSSLVLPSPFPRENLRVLVVPTVSTVFRERPRFYDKVAATVREVYEAHPGHWACYVPSFAYLRAVAERLGRMAGEVLVQEERMSDGERAAVLERLLLPDGTPRLLLAVLGGVFAEGVDLPGTALVGAVVVSPGLPQLSLDRELLKQRLEESYGAGFEYAYLVPGMSRVVQAAGRLVRSETDRGVVVLLDRRFARPEYARLLPRDWYDASPAELVVRDPAAEVYRFFAGSPNAVSGADSGMTWISSPKSKR